MANDVDTSSATALLNHVEVVGKFVHGYKADTVAQFTFVFIKAKTLRAQYCATLLDEEPHQIGVGPIDGTTEWLLGVDDGAREVLHSTPSHGIVLPDLQDVGNQFARWQVHEPVGADFEVGQAAELNNNARAALQGEVRRDVVSPLKLVVVGNVEVRHRRLLSVIAETGENYRTGWL